MRAAVAIAFDSQSFAMISCDPRYGTLAADGTYRCTNYGNGFAASGAVPLSSLGHRDVVSVTISGTSMCFALSIASTNALNCYVLHYNYNHHTAFHYYSGCGLVNSDYTGSYGTFARHYGYVPFTAVLTLRGSDRSVSFAVNGVQQVGSWPLPTAPAFYLMLATGSIYTPSIAVTDVTKTTTE